MAEDANIDAYFERIGFAGSIAPSLETLAQLHQLHPAAIPFETIDPLIGAPIRLDLRNLQQKLLFDRRGGYCLEHNLLFKAVLQSLDFEVAAHPARVLWGDPDSQRAPSHLVLTTSIAGAPYLADVGFGGLTMTAPLRLRADVEQPTPHEPFRVVGGDPVWRVEVKIGEEFRPLYEFEPVGIDDAGVGQLNETAQSATGFRENLIAARAERGRRLALENLRFTTYPVGGEKEVRHLATAAEVKDVLRTAFGIELPSDERLDPALERLVSRAMETGNP